MRILWHSNAPWVTTGYGQQTAHFAPLVKALGHDVAISSFIGLQGAAVPWNDITVLPSRKDIHGNDTVLANAEDHFGSAKGGLTLTLSDVWVLKPDVFRQMNVASWVPVDCEPLSSMDLKWFKATNAQPIAMSRHGERMLRDAGLTPLYVPHGIDTEVFAPMDQSAAREALGFQSDAFIIGINAANASTSPPRKAFTEQLRAFWTFAQKHGDAMLYLHTNMDRSARTELDMWKLMDAIGIDRARVIVPDQQAYRSGRLDMAYLRTVYAACDVVSNATYGEGFGLATIEAQACGTPVVVTDNSASAELCGAGWKVPGEPFWNAMHEAWWSAPRVDDLVRAYRKAYSSRGNEQLRMKARRFALDYDAAAITERYWKPALKVIEGVLC